MSVTMQLLAVFRVDSQLRSLTKRSETAERFFRDQSRQLSELGAKRDAIAASLKQARATAANDEGEAARLDQRIVALREQMNNAQNAKEFNAFLSELNNFKEAKGKAEEAALASMGKIESLEKDLAAIEAQHAERAKLVKQAECDRDAKFAEVKDRVEQLKAERKKLAAEAPPDALSQLEKLIELHGDEAMAPVEVLDRRNLEYSCGSCMMALPVEAVSSLLRGDLAKCSTCQCILYTEEELLAAAKPQRRSKKKTQAAET